MPTSEVWGIVRVPFPYTDRPVRQHRPALVVAADELRSAHALLWVLMITSADNRGWPEDVLISNHSLSVGDRAAVRPHLRHIIAPLSRE